MKERDRVLRNAARMACAIYTTMVLGGNWSATTVPEPRTSIVYSVEDIRAIIQNASPEKREEIRLEGLEGRHY